MIRVTVSKSSHTVACYCLVALLVLTLAGSVKNSHGGGIGEKFQTAAKGRARDCEVWRGKQMMARPCEELYVVGEGETLQSIGEKCGDPFIVERNPHIHDPDDIFPGLLIKLHINVS